jgi:uncharacterized protein (UPF0261 family)
MRTTVEENKKIALNMAERINYSKGSAAIMFPLKGFSGLDIEGQQFHGPEENQMLMDTLKEQINHQKVEIIEADYHINDKDFAESAAEKLLQLIEEKKGDI